MQFEKIVEVFEDDPAFSQVHALIIYGSRTHFSYGYPAKSESDLDFVMTSLDSAGFRDRDYLAWIEKAEIAFAPLAFELGIEINHLPAAAGTESLSLKEIYDEYMTAKTLEQMTEYWEWWQPRLTRQFAAHQRKLAWLKISGDLFNKEAIFILRDTPANRRLAAALAQRHYTNVVFAKAY